MAGLKDASEIKHHQLKQLKVSFNSTKIISLVESFDQRGYSFDQNEDKRLYNMAAGRAFPECII